MTGATHTVALHHKHMYCTLMHCMVFLISQSAGKYLTDCVAQQIFTQILAVLLNKKIIEGTVTWKPDKANKSSL